MQIRLSLMLSLQDGGTGGANLFVAHYATGPATQRKDSTVRRSPRPDYGGDQRWAALHEAAFDYASLGEWRILPGTVWNGERYIRGLSDKPAGELEPLWAPSRATRNARKIYAWWSWAPFSILALTGEVFDLLDVPNPLADQALRAGLAEPTPVSRGPDGMRFVLAPGCALPADLEALGVRRVPPDSLVPMPPTPIRGGELTWCVSPDDTRWRWPAADSVFAALRSAAHIELTDQFEQPEKGTPHARHSVRDSHVLRGCGFPVGQPISDPPTTRWCR